MTNRSLCLFALNATAALGSAVAAELSLPLAGHEEREFEDGEHKTRPLEAVRGAHVFVMQSLHGEANQSANDKLCRLLFFIDAIKDAGAARVTAMVPYLCYARKDRRTKTSDRSVSSLLTRAVPSVRIFFMRHCRPNSVGRLEKVWPTSGEAEVSSRAIFSLARSTEPLHL